MSQLVARRWTIDEFFVWQDEQPVRYELVDGAPVRMMAGAKNIHDRAVVNLLILLGIQLRGTGCRPFTGDSSIETYPGQIRRPDAGVDCGQFDPNGLRAATPRMVAEVLSPSTRDFDTIEKLAEYKSVETLDYVLVIEPNAAQVVLWSRSDDRSWARARTEGLDAEIALPSIGITLRLADLYDEIEFPAGPSLVYP